MEEIFESSFILHTNPKCGNEIARIFLVHDANNAANDAVIQFFSDLGYHVVTLLLEDTMFKSVRDFLAEFEKLVKAKKDEFVFTVVHYAQSDTKDMCMYCSEEIQKNALLLKQAFATLYVVLGRQRCTLIAPERCCDFNVAHLPRAQVEGMAIYVVYPPPAPTRPSAQTTTKEGTVMSLVSAGKSSGSGAEATLRDVYPREVWDELRAKIDTLRLIDSHKPETQHRRTLVEEVVEETEEALTLEQVVRLLSKVITELDVAEKFAGLVGISAMEWGEYVKRSGEQTVYLILRRCMISLKEDGALTKIAEALDSLAQSDAVLTELARLTREYQTTKTVYLSKFPAITAGSDSRSPSKTRGTGPWKSGVEEPEAETGTHLDKLQSQFIPPYMRAALVDKSDKTPEEVAELEKAAEEAARRAQELDQEYERRKLANEIHENQLMGGFSSRDHFPSKAKGGECPM